MTDTSQTVQSPWRAQWITPPEDMREDNRNRPAVDEQQPRSRGANTWYCFRKTVSLPQVPARVTAAIACDSKYWLWVNEELVVFEGQLKRGPAPGDTYYDSVELAPYLKAGSNTLAVLVWYFGKQGFSHQDSGQAGLFFQLDGLEGPLATDAGWKVMRHPAFEETAAPHPNYRLPESNVRFDARHDIGSWQRSAFSDADWPHAVAAGAPPAVPWGQLVCRPIPPWVRTELQDYESITEEKADGANRLMRCRLPYNVQVTPYLEIKAPEGVVVRVRTDHYRIDSVPSVRAEYVTCDGEQQFECPGWMNGHEVLYQVPKGVEVLALKYRETRYDTESSGAFACDDVFLNALWEQSRRTLLVCMRDTYMDCPDRERAQWWGDEVNQLAQSFYALCPRSHALIRKGMVELINWQRPDGTLFSPCPAGNYDRELPMQMLAAVGELGFWTYYMHTGDAETIRALYPGVKRYLDVWQLGAHSLTAPREGGWCWGDWGENKDMTVLFSTWHYQALQGQRKMAELVGARDDLPGIDRRLGAIRDNFNRIFWNGTAFRSADYAGATDDRANAMAVVVGLARPEQYPDIRDVLTTAFHASPYMEYYVLEALILMGYLDDALARMKTRFAPLVASSDSTLCEHWDTEAGSRNHAWSGGALILMSRYLAGIEPIEPGYRRFAIRPQMGPLSRVDATVDSVGGVISVSLRRDGKIVTAGIVVPDGTVAEYRVPTLGPGGRPEEDEIRELGPGKWKIEAEW